MRILAIGVLAAVGLSLSIPAYADSVSIGIGENGVRVHERDHHGWREHRGDRERARVVVREREHHRHCRVTVIHRDGMTKRIKRCD
jgi:hypothetical protein